MQTRTKLDRQCPRCRKRLYHFARRELTLKPGTAFTGIHYVEIDCADCGHSWRGRYRVDEWE